jgi:hypothetical protein
MQFRRYHHLSISFLLLLVYLGLQASQNVLAFEVDYGGRIPTPIRTRKPPVNPTATPTLTATPTPTQTVPVILETTPVPTHIPPGGRGNADMIGFAAGAIGGLLLLIPLLVIWCIRERKIT